MLYIAAFVLDFWNDYAPFLFINWLVGTKDCDYSGDLEKVRSPPEFEKASSDLIWWCVWFSWAVSGWPPPPKSLLTKLRSWYLRLCTILTLSYLLLFDNTGESNLLPFANDYYCLYYFSFLRLIKKCYK